MSLTESLNLLSLSVLLISGVFLSIRYFVKGKVSDDNDKFTSLMQSIETRNIEIDDLKQRVDKLEEDNKMLMQRNQQLEIEKNVLEKTVSGVDYLIKLTESVDQFQEWAKRASEEHKSILNAQLNIEKKLTLKHKAPSKLSIA